MSYTQSRRHLRSVYIFCFFDITYELIMMVAYSLLIVNMFLKNIFLDFYYGTFYSKLNKHTWRV